MLNHSMHATTNRQGNDQAECESVARCENMDTLTVCVYLAIYILIFSVSLRDSLLEIEIDKTEENEQHEC